MSLDLRYAPQTMRVEWKERIAKGVCAVCGRPKQKGERFLQYRVHRDAACSVPWAAITWTWGNFRDHYLHQPGIGCAMCGKPHDFEFQLDHKIPVAAGGNPRALDNLQPLCYSCHKIKTRLDVQNIRHGLAVDVFKNQRKLVTK
jgi:5-methylcytosine-specific restriction endonuclease McrA